MIVETLQSKLQTVDEKLKVAVERTDLHPIAATSKKLCDGMAKNNARFREVIGELAGRRKRMEAVLANADTDDFGAVLAEMEQQKSDLPVSVQELAVLWGQREKFALEMKTELEARVEPAIAARDKKLTEVRAELTRIGQGVEAQQAYPSNGVAAEMQLDHLVKSNVQVRPLIAAAEDAQVHVKAALDQVRHSRTGKAAAQAYLRTLAMRAAEL